MCTSCYLQGVWKTKWWVVFKEHMTFVDSETCWKLVDLCQLVCFKAASHASVRMCFLMASYQRGD